MAGAEGADPRRSAADLDLRTWLLQVTSKVSAILAKDEGGRAYISAMDWLRRAFSADSASLYSADSNGRRLRYSAAGEWPFGSLPGDSAAGIDVSAAEWAQIEFGFSPGILFSLTGAAADSGPLGSPAYWLWARFDAVEREEGCLLLGKTAGPWSTEDETALISLAGTLTSIVVARRERERETRERLAAEELLAKSEKRLRGIFEDARDMVYTADAEDLVTSINAAGVGLTGYSRKSDILGQPFSELVLNPGDRAIFLRKLREAGFVDDYEIIMKRRDGKTVFCLENATAVKGETGAMVEVHGIIKDISDRVEGERELWKTNLELAEANLKLQQTQLIMVQHEKLASIGQLAAGVAHEINNPLSYLKSNQTMLEKYLRDMKRILPMPGEDIPEGELQARREGIHRLMARIEDISRESNEGIARIMAIVSNLKNFSRVDRAEDFGDYDLNQGIETTLVVSWNEIKYVAEVTRDFAEILPLRAKGNEINQVILNVLVNAAQAIGGQGRSAKGNITLRTRMKGEYAILDIEDDGPGIPEALRSKIFDPFFTTKDPGKGTGLGLSISYDIVVNKHGGRLTVGDLPGGGRCSRSRCRSPVPPAAGRARDQSPRPAATSASISPSSTP